MKFQFISGTFILLSFFILGDYLMNWEPNSLIIQAVLAIIRFPLFIIWWPIIGFALLWGGWQEYKTTSE